MVDHVLRAGDGLAHLRELLQRLLALIPRAGPDTSPGTPARNVDALVWQQALGLLQSQQADLQATLASLSQGVFKTAAKGRISIYKQHLPELDLPESLLAARPTLRADAHTGPARRQLWRGFRRQLGRSFADVSDYARSAQALRESEARFRSLSELSSDGYREHDAQGRLVQLAGDLSAKELARAELIGSTRWKIGALNMTEVDRAAQRALLVARQPFRDRDLQRQRADRSTHWISVSCVPVRDADGGLRSYRGLGRDITERKSAESRIERLGQC